MPNDAFTQQALAVDLRFRLRVRAALAKVAWTVLDELTSVPNHTTRANFARQVIQNLDGQTTQIMPWLVMRTNLFAAATSYDFTQGAVVSAVTDAAIESQLTTDWNDLAGIIE